MLPSSNKGFIIIIIIIIIITWNDGSLRDEIEIGLYGKALLLSWALASDFSLFSILLRCQIVKMHFL